MFGVCWFETYRNVRVTPTNVKNLALWDDVQKPGTDVVCIGFQYAALRHVREGNEGMKVDHVDPIQALQGRWERNICEKRKKIQLHIL
jgi:hypothetical protein